MIRPGARPLAAARRAQALALRAQADALEAEADLLECENTPDPWLPIAAAAGELGMRVRGLRDAARRGDLVIEGPRSARVVRRSELDRFIASKRLAPRESTSRVDDAREAARASVARAACRIARSA